MLITYAKTTLLLFLLTGMIYGAVDSSDTTQKVNSKTLITFDINADNKKDSLLCEISGKSWNNPLTTHYTIICNGAVILSETSFDEALDEQFGNTNAMDWCSDYLACKKKWYLKRLPKSLFIIIKQGDDRRENLFDTLSDMAIPYLAQKLYKDSLGYSNEKAITEVKKLMTFLKKNDFVLIMLPANPIYRPFPRLYDPFSKKFIQLFGY